MSHPQTAAGEITPRISPAASAFLNETVRLNNDLKQLTRRLSSIAVMHCSRLQPNGETVCACCLLPYPCGTVILARGGAE